MYYNSRRCYYSEPVNYYPRMYEEYYPYRNEPIIKEPNVGNDSGSGDSGMGLSARNRFRGVVTDIKMGSVVGEVLVDLGCNHLASAVITTTSIRNLRLRVGSRVNVVIKATSVMIRKTGDSDSDFSARNQFPGTVTEVNAGDVVGEVIVDIGCGHIVSAVITTTSINNLGIKIGSKVSAVIKATEVMIMAGN
ncbi:TOBE domain-containing protein [Clostridium arbusti]|jgi:molybdate transport system regulatory protein|uniref:TOBE domain-containing protein n=1 Tax=Clostridium arbusti TaxID=1137848 RepID=UPI0002884162|nr:TOBE domain-containing protein [Clostridium arbusti]